MALRTTGGTALQGVRGNAPHLRGRGTLNILGGGAVHVFGDGTLHPRLD